VRPEETEKKAEKKDREEAGKRQKEPYTAPELAKFGPVEKFTGISAS
jgi:hypothetical protein